MPPSSAGRMLWETGILGATSKPAKLGPRLPCAFTAHTSIPRAAVQCRVGPGCIAHQCADGRPTRGAFARPTQETRPLSLHLQPLDKGLAKTCREVGHLCPSSARASRRLEGRYIWYGEEADPLRFAAPDTNGWHRSPGLPCPPDRRVPHRPWEPIMTPARGHAAGALSVLQRACPVAPSSFALAQACLPTDGYPPDAVGSPLRSGRLSVPSQTTTYSRLPSVCPGSLTVIRTPPALLQRWSLCLFPVTSGHIPCPPAAAEGILPPERQAARAIRSSNAYQSLAAR
ncbi:hypothetical protein PCL_07660 [Purpureocillium lilacinum]|uniref:Uncharacterized protein n=1 Tax=Purpureocillium lilacinum TaxID=33203 RepID=A0A2U3EIL2_PURLI|nr:hypothetical protein Purlil1_4452 [Purpureocillium lilacinum]PWI74346.1 hypothetical protein PCL_07660 [Purpureocillium lilacinum]